MQESGNRAVDDPSRKGFGVPGHRGVPLISAWGIHIGLSYQRPGWKQASLAEIIREGIDRFVKWGANLVDLFPSNKEAHFDEYSVFEDAALPEHTFREHPDANQENRWTLREFLEFNRHAHEHDFLVTWMIHCWWPTPVAQRARALWRLFRQAGQDVADVALDGFGSHIDGYAAEGDCLMPAAANNILWQHHPGMYLRESAWGLSTTAANYIQPRGFHLTDGRVLMYDREDYMGLSPECWRGFEAIWRGEELRVRHGRLFVSLQVEGRDTKCQDPGWANFGGMATVDMLVEQVNNYARAKGRGWSTAGTTEIRVINETLISPKMKRYIGGLCGDPVRAAVTAPLEATASDGRYPRVEYPQGAWFCQNNRFRVYLDKRTGAADLHHDSAAQANFTNFLWNTSTPVLNDWLGVESFGPDAKLHFVEYVAREEAGCVATVRQRLEYRSGAESMGEHRDFVVEADNPWLWVRIQRVFLGQSPGRRAISVLRLPGYRPLDPVRIDEAVRLAPPEGKPPLWVYLPPAEQIESVAWRDEGRLEIVCKAAASHDFRVGLRIDAPDQPDAGLRNGVARFYAQTLEFDWQKRADDELTVENPTGEEAVRAVRILHPPAGAYRVREDGWWQPRGAQPSWEQRGTDLLKIVVGPKASSAIGAGGFIAGVVKNGWGCQYTQLIRDVEAGPRGAGVTVRVVDVGPTAWAPRLHFVRPIAAVELDGKPWHYFEGPFVMLPSARGDYHVRVQFGPAASPHLACTFAVISATEWDGSTLSVTTSLPEWCDSLADEEQYFLAVRNEGRSLEEVVGGRVARSVPDFDAARPMPMCGPEGVGRLVPRDYNHPPLDGYNTDKCHVIAFRPPAGVALRFR
jgi:hypothetical protein